MSYSWYDQYGDAPDSIRGIATKINQCVNKKMPKMKRALCVKKQVIELRKLARWLKEGFEEFG